MLISFFVYVCFLSFYLSHQPRAYKYSLGAKDYPRSVFLEILSEAGGGNSGTLPRPLSIPKEMATTGIENDESVLHKHKGKGKEDEGCDVTMRIGLQGERCTLESRTMNREDEEEMDVCNKVGLVNARCLLDGLRDSYQ